MFSFHKPKVYRSPQGCCICKAKSSSSRFTDSRKYEQDFIPCFELKAPRQGEICNACVLLVKRWKKLPPGSSRNWRHVVDARAGPGMKSMIKCKSKSKNNGNGGNGGKTDKASVATDAIEKIMKKKKSGELIRETSPALSDDPLCEDFASASIEIKSPGSASDDSYEMIETPSPSNEMNTMGVTANPRNETRKRQRSVSPSFIESSFLDMTLWKRKLTCCGIVFIGPAGELLIDPQFFKQCKHKALSSSTVPKSSTATPTATPATNSALESTESDVKIKSYSDSSSDSGYDESSNQGIDRHDSISVSILEESCDH